MAQSLFSNLDNLSLRDIESEADLIPLMTTEDEEALESESLPEVVPILPLRNTVLFPGVVIPITAGRDKSIKLIKDANATNKIIHSKNLQVVFGDHPDKVFQDSKIKDIVALYISVTTDKFPETHIDIFSLSWCFISKIDIKDHA